MDCLISKLWSRVRSNYKPCCPAKGTNIRISHFHSCLVFIHKINGWLTDYVDIFRWQRWQQMAFCFGWHWLAEPNQWASSNCYSNFCCHGEWQVVRPYQLWRWNWQNGPGMSLLNWYIFTYIIILLTKREVKMAGYRPRSLLAYGPRLRFKLAKSLGQEKFNYME